MSTTTSNTRPHYAHVVEVEGKVAAVFTSRAAAVEFTHSIGRSTYDDGVTVTKWNTTTGERQIGRARLKSYCFDK